MYKKEPSEERVSLMLMNSFFQKTNKASLINKENRKEFDLNQSYIENHFFEC